MYNIEEIKREIEDGKIALNESLESRIMNDAMTEEDHAFLEMSYGQKLLLQEHLTSYADYKKLRRKAMIKQQLELMKDPHVWIMIAIIAGGIIIGVKLGQ